MEEASPDQLGLSPSGNLELDGGTPHDEIEEALAAAAQAVPLDAEGSDSQAESQEAAPPAPVRKTEPATEPKPQEETPARQDKAPTQDWALLHREKRELFAQQQEFKAQKAEYDRIQSVLANAKQDRLAALEAMGYDNIKEFVEGLAEDGGRMTPERRELNELKQWRKSQEAAAQEQKQAAEQQAQQHALQAKLDHLRGQVKNRIASQDFSERLINLKDADEQVMLEMDRMATETGQMPDVDAAIERVEGRFHSYLEEMTQNPAVMAYFREKLGSRQLPSGGAPQSKQRAKPRTIGNQMPSPGLDQTESSRRNSSFDDDVEDAIRSLKEMAR